MGSVSPRAAVAQIAEHAAAVNPAATPVNRAGAGATPGPSGGATHGRGRLARALASGLLAVGIAHVAIACGVESAALVVGLAAMAFAGAWGACRGC